MKYRLKQEAKTKLKHLLKETLIVLSYTFAIFFILFVVMIMTIYPMDNKSSIIETIIAWIGYLFVLYKVVCYVVCYIAEWIVNNIEPIEE